MTAESSTILPRLADALHEVSVRLDEIGEELRALPVGVTTSATIQPTAEPEPNPVTASLPLTPPAFPPPWVASPPPATPPPTPLPVSQPAPPQQVWTPAQPVPYVAPPRLPRRPTLWEQATKDGAGSRILAWAGGVVTLAGVVLLLVLAIQRGYLGPAPRVLLGAGLGLALAGIGIGLYRNPNARTGAYALAATGIAVLYLDVIAATTLHGFLPPWAGLLTGLAVAGGGIALAGRWNSQLLAVFVVACCTVCAPVLTEGFNALLLGFLLVLQIATTPVQTGRRWGVLCLAAGVPPLIAALISIAIAAEGGSDAAAVAYLCLVTSIVQVAVATVSATFRPADEIPFVLLLAAPAPTLLAAILLPRAGAAALPATIGTLLVLLWGLWRGESLAVPRKFAMAAGGAGAVAVFQATATALDSHVLALALLGEALLLGLIALRLRYRAALLAATTFAVAGLAVTVGFAAPPTLLVVPPEEELAPGTVATAGLTGLLLAVVAIALGAVELRLAGGRAPLGWQAAGVAALYGASTAVLTVGLAVTSDGTGFLLGHVLVTVSWTVGALVLLLRGIDSVPLRVAGLTLVAAALAKLVLFDLSSLDGLARVAAFLVAGLVLLAAGARYAKLVATRDHERTPNGNNLPAGAG